MVSFTPLEFIPMERAPGTHWIGGWMGLKAGLDAVRTGIKYVEAIKLLREPQPYREAELLQQALHT
jgi:hypothetical protein